MDPPCEAVAVLRAEDHVAAWHAVEEGLHGTWEVAPRTCVEGIRRAVEEEDALAEALHHRELHPVSFVCCFCRPLIPWL